MDYELTIDIDLEDKNGNTTGIIKKGTKVTFISDSREPLILVGNDDDCFIIDKKYLKEIYECPYDRTY